MGGRRLDVRLQVGSVLNYSDFFRLLAELQHRVETDRGIRVDGQVVFLLGPEAGRIDGERVLANRQVGKDVGAHGVRGGVEFGFERVVDDGQFGARNYRAALVLDGPRESASGYGPHQVRGQEG